MILPSLATSPIFLAVAYQFQVRIDELRHVIACRSLRAKLPNVWRRSALVHVAAIGLLKLHI